MSRKKGNSKPPEFLTTKLTFYRNHYIYLFDEMIDSPAYIALSDGAKYVYTLLVREYKGMYTGNTVKCPYSTMVAHGVRKSSIKHWLDELEVLGFIRIVSHGGMFKIPNEYRLINDWAKFKSVEEAIQWLKVINTKEFGWDEFALQESQKEIRERCEQGVREATDMAIEALKNEPINCVKCKHYYECYGTTFVLMESHTKAVIQNDKRRSTYIT